MADRFFPLPFVGVKRGEYEATSYDKAQSFYLNVGGVNINGVTLEEHDSWQESYRLPTGRIQNYQIHDPKTHAFQSETIRVEGQPGTPTYTYERDSKGMHFYRQDHADGARVAIGQKDFMAGVNAVVGAYDSNYTTALALAFSKFKTAPHETIDVPMGQTSRIRVVMDANAASVQQMDANEEGQQHKVLGAYHRGGKVMQQTPIILGRGNGALWMSNDWTPDLQDKLSKVMPSDDWQRIREAMKRGKLSLEVMEDDSNQVCRAIMGKPKKSEPDACKNTR